MVGSGKIPETRSIDVYDCLRVWQTGEFGVSLKPFLAWLKAHRLALLLGWRAKRRGWTLPDEVAQFVHRATYQGMARHAVAGGQLRVLSELARAWQIPVVAVKGPVVAKAYPDVAFRIYNDLDFLVPEDKAEPLISILLQHGYHRDLRGIRMPHFPPLHPEGAGLRLEIHTTLDDHPGGGRFTYSEWSDRLRPWPVYPGLWVPDPVDHIIYLVDHAVIRHKLLGGLQLLTDLRFWTENWNASLWEALVMRSREMGLHRTVALALALTAWFWDEPLPDLVQRWFSSPPDDVLTQSKALAIGSLPTSMPQVSSDLPHERPFHWIRYGVEIFLGNPIYRQSLSLGDRMLFYLRRPFRLLARYAPVVWQHLTGKVVERGAWQAHREVNAWLRGSD